jgi:DNA-directed RNA polymerase specialized sigma24 family protein
MPEYDWQLSAGSPLCVFSDSFYYSVRDAIFRQLSKDSSKEQFQAALESLTRLREELEQDLHPMHYGALIGRHRCVEHLFREARARLRGLEITQPPPKPPVPPAPTQPPLTQDAVVNNLRTLAKDRTRRRDTYLGQEVRQPPPERTE